MRLHHIGLFTNHPKRILDFYEEKLGFRKEYKMRIPKYTIRSIFGIAQDCFMVKLTFRDSIHLEVFWSVSDKLKSRPAGIVGYNHFGLEVSNRDKFCTRLVRRFKIRLIKVKRDNHYTYFIQDPDRNLIEIMKAK